MDLSRGCACVNGLRFGAVRLSKRTCVLHSAYAWHQGCGLGTHRARQRRMPSPTRSGCIVIGHATLLPSFQRRFGFARAIAADCRLTSRVPCPRSRRPRSTRRSSSRVGPCCRVKTSAGRGRRPAADRRHRSRGSVACEWSFVSVRRRSGAVGVVCSCRSGWGIVENRYSSSTGTQAATCTTDICTHPFAPLEHKSS